jgi:hypothetical protein
LLNVSVQLANKRGLKKRVPNSSGILATKTGFFLTNPFDLQVRPPLPKKLPVPSLIGKLDSKLKLDLIGEPHGYGDSYYVSSFTVLTMKASTSHSLMGLYSLLYRKSSLFT